MSVDLYEVFLVYREGYPPTLIARSEIEREGPGDTAFAMYAVPNKPGHKGADLNALTLRRASARQVRFAITEGP